MERLDKVCAKLEHLKSISGKNEKQTYVKLNKDDKDFLVMLSVRLDPFFHTKIKTLPRIEYALKDKRELTYVKFFNLLSDLASNNINAAARKNVEDTIASGNWEYSEILEGLVTKTLNLGIDTGVNKALGYELIPSFDVMLASPLKEGMDVTLPAQVDLKYDGVRCLAVVEDGECTLYTRQGRELDFPLISKEIIQLASKENITFDGELLTQSRTGISGICNSNLKTGYDDGMDDFIEYFVFDEIPTDIFKKMGTTKKQSERSLDLSKRFMNFTKARRVKQSESQVVYSMDKLMQINNDYIKNGEEGVIVKDLDALYAYKRNKAWLKLKALNSTTLKIVGAAEGKGKRKGKIGALICESSDGLIKVNVGSGLNDVDVDLFTSKPPLGKFVEVLFNVLIKGRDSDTYSLFLPRYKEIRIDKTEADSLAKVKKEHIGEVQE